MAGGKKCMVEFKTLRQGLAVKVDGNDLGIISEDHGFFTDAGILKTWVRVSPDDLRRIADKAEAVKKVGKFPEVQRV